MTNKQEKIEPELISSKSLATIATWLDGYLLGKGNIQPMGTYDLDQLWKAVKYLRGDSRYIAEKDKGVL